MYHESQVYSPGDLVWGKSGGHPWWPGMICNDPHGNTYIHKEDASEKYHVQFFSVPSSHAWIHINFIHPYKGKHVPECSVGGMYYSSRKSMITALSKVERAQFLTFKERLQQFCSYGKSVKKGRTSVMEKLMKKSSKCPTAQKTFIVGKTKIPSRWKEAFVLMDTGDVPESLKPGDLYNLAAPTKRIKVELPDDSGSDVNDIDSEDELVDSDEDPGWTPEMNITTSNKRGKEILPYLGVDLSDNDDDVDSDKDPVWTPDETNKTAVKKNSHEKKRKYMNRDKNIASMPSRVMSPPLKTSSQFSTNNASISESTVSESSMLAPSSSLLRSSKDSTSTGPEPEVGEFVLEKSVCKNGKVPCLWQYKKGGLIQKYARQVENGQECYVNVENYAKWWSCNSHKFQKVETKHVHRNRNKEKVELVNKPEVLKQLICETSSNSRVSQPQQEQEISSTTNDEPQYQVGGFVLDIKDRSNVDNFSIWKIESSMLLKKFEAVVKNGRLLHRPVKTYRGYREIKKHYLPVKVSAVSGVTGEFVEVSEDTKPNVSIDSGLEKEYEKNPLLRHFYVYMQVFLSQALEPGFFAEVKKSNDPTYMFPLSEIDKIVEQKKINIERKVKWTHRIKDALNKCPYLREVHKPDDSKTCEGRVNSKDAVEEAVFLFGSVYDKDTLKQSGTSYSAPEFRIGKTSMEYIGTYHQLCHFKFNLYDRCLAKIKLIQDSHKDIEVEEIMDKCLGNKSWVLQNFEYFMNLVEIM